MHTYTHTHAHIHTHTCTHPYTRMHTYAQYAVRTDFDEMSVHGAAVAAGIAVQIWEDISVLPIPSTSTFQPKITSDGNQILN